MKSVNRRLATLEFSYSLGPRQPWMGPRKFRASVPPIRLRFGHVRKLPADYLGERHVIIAKQLPERDGQEWVEFEEVPGPAPSEPAPDTRLPQYLDIMLVASPGAARAEVE